MLTRRYFSHNWTFITVKTFLEIESCWDMFGKTTTANVQKCQSFFSIHELIYFFNVSSEGIIITILIKIFRTTHSNTAPTKTNNTIKTDYACSANNMVVNYKNSFSTPFAFLSPT